MKKSNSTVAFKYFLLIMLAFMLTACGTKPKQVVYVHAVGTALDSFVQLEDGYLLIGRLQWSSTDYPAYAIRPIMNLVKVTDAAGKEIAFTPWPKSSSNLPKNEEYISYWAIKIKGKAFAAPLTVSMGSVFVNINPFSFHFDPGVGLDLTGDSKVDLNQDVQIGDTSIRILTIHRAKMSDNSPFNGEYAYQADIQIDPNAVGDVYIRSLNDECPNPPDYIVDDSYPTERLSLGLALPVFSCSKDLPSKPLEMQVTGAVLWGSWQFSWAP